MSAAAAARGTASPAARRRIIMAADPLKRRGEAGMSIFVWSFPMDFWEDATAPVAHLGPKLSFAPQAAGSARHIVRLTGVTLATSTRSSFQAWRERHNALC